MPAIYPRPPDFLTSTIGPERLKIRFIQGFLGSRQRRALSLIRFVGCQRLAHLRMCNSELPSNPWRRDASFEGGANSIQLSLCQRRRNFLGVVFAGNSIRPRRFPTTPLLFSEDC